MTDTYRRIVLADRPVGEPTAANFALREEPVPEPGAGELLCRTIYLSLDPYMRGRMSEAKSYADPVAVGATMVGGTVSQVVKSNNPAFKGGDFVAGMTGWTEFAVDNGAAMRKLDPAQAPLSTALGVLGMPGVTAHTGLMNIGRPQAGETVVVAAASGPVGGMVGQIAKIKGCRAVGIAGSPEKCAHVVDVLGFDACVSHRDPGFRTALGKACPDGIDVYFENVGGAVWETVMPLLNPFARVPVCGLIAGYNMTELPPGPNKIPLMMRDVLTKRLTLRGFIVSDFLDQWPQALGEIAGWLREGKVAYREDVVQGLENAPEAFMGLLKGRNFGKLVVQVGHDPTA
ncbi:MAG: NADP-dependent oxidoreductase [Hyphomicrobiales bacterium]|nr:NADP-dependent oxidoreductase [Hyphomicrobiales bacterium]MCP5371339.1 NADP-dependent oxidoreductase [Hyphomicrobiales bacterium]